MKRWYLVVALCLVCISPRLTPQRATADGVRYKDEVFSSASLSSNITYGRAPGYNGKQVSLKLDLYQPTGDTAPLRPAFVWAHGGNFVAGDKADSLDAEIASRFAKRGYVSISINYRIHPNVEEWEPAALAQATLDAQHDAQAAVRWLRANAAAYRIDPSRIAIAGFSSGAVIALQVNYNSGNVGTSGNPGYSSQTSACADIAGWTDVSLIDSGESPNLVVHGTADALPFVPFSDAVDIVTQSTDVGVTSDFHPIEGATHDVWTVNKEEIVTWMGDFFYQYVMDPPPVGGEAQHLQLAPAVVAAHRGFGAARYIATVVGATIMILALGTWVARKKTDQQS